MRDRVLRQRSGASVALKRESCSSRERERANATPPATRVNARPRGLSTILYSSHYKLFLFHPFTQSLSPCSRTIVTHARRFGVTERPLSRTLAESVLSSARAAVSQALDRIPSSASRCYAAIQQSEHPAAKALTKLTGESSSEIALANSLQSESVVRQNHPAARFSAFRHRVVLQRRHADPGTRGNS